MREGRAGTRRLVIGLVANGRDFAADAGTYVTAVPYLHEIEEIELCVCKCRNYVISISVILSA